jgi:hypothetical protein
MNPCTGGGTLGGMSNPLLSSDSLANWVEALGTAGGLGVTGVALLLTWWDRQRRQASGVDVFVVRSSFDPPETWPAETLGHTNFEYSIENHSDGMVKGLVLRVRDIEGDQPGKFGAMGPLAPGFKDNVPATAGAQTHGLGELFIEFYDAAGRGWRRDQNGRLSRCRRPMPNDFHDVVVWPPPPPGRLVRLRRRLKNLRHGAMYKG